MSSVQTLSRSPFAKQPDPQSSLHNGTPTKNNALFHQNVPNDSSLEIGNPLHVSEDRMSRSSTPLSNCSIATTTDDEEEAVPQTNEDVNAEDNKEKEDELKSKAPTKRPRNTNRRRRGGGWKRKQPNKNANGLTSTTNPEVEQQRAKSSDEEAGTLGCWGMTVCRQRRRECAQQ
jgi:hypothetical protein